MNIIKKLQKFNKLNYAVSKPSLEGHIRENEIDMKDYFIIAEDQIANDNYFKCYYLCHRAEYIQFLNELKQDSGKILPFYEMSKFNQPIKIYCDYDRDFSTPCNIQQIDIVKQQLESDISDFFRMYLKKINVEKDFKISFIESHKIKNDKVFKISFHIFINATNDDEDICF